MSHIAAQKADDLMKTLQQRTDEKKAASVAPNFSENTLFLLKNRQTRGELDLRAIEKDIRKQAWIEKLPVHVVSNKAVFHDVIRVLSLKTYKAGTILHKAGSPVDTLYVVVSGCVASAHITHDIITDKVEEHVFRRFRSGDVAGSQFLDLWKDWDTALKVECDGTELLELHRSDYSEVMDIHESREVKERAAFLKNIPPFSNWGEAERINMAQMLTVEQHPSNTTIVKQGGVPKKFYIIFKGYCRILKEIAAPCKSLTILRAPLDLKTLSHYSSNPQPITVKRRPVTADLHSGKSRNFGTTSFRCPIWREAFPRPHRWNLIDSTTLHDRPFSVRATTHTTSTPKQPQSNHSMNPQSPAKSAGSLGGRTPWSRGSTSDVFDTTPLSTPRWNSKRRPPWLTLQPDRENTWNSREGGPSPRSEYTTPRGAAKTPRRKKQLRVSVLDEDGSCDEARSPLASIPQSPSRRRAIMKSKVVHDFFGDELEGSKKVILELREMWRGQYFGEHGIINKNVNTATVVSSSIVQLLVLSKLDFCRLQQDTGEGARELLNASERFGYRNDTDDIVEAMEDEFHWMNFKQDISTDAVLGSRFADQALAAGTTGWAELDHPRK